MLEQVIKKVNILNEKIMRIENRPGYTTNITSNFAQMNFKQTKLLLFIDFDLLRSLPRPPHLLPLLKRS